MHPSSVGANLVFTLRTIFEKACEGEHKVRPYHMNTRNEHPVIEKVRRALGRPEPLTEAPTPPEIDEHVARLVYSAIGLPELFAKRAADLKMKVETVAIEELLEKAAAFLHEQGVKRIMLSDTSILTKLGAAEFFAQSGFDSKRWEDMSADEAYDFDAGVTEVDYAVAETGSLVIRHRPEHGRLISLVPLVHIAIVHPGQFVPDLIDLFETLKKDGLGSGVTIISGPSKTSDIEMTLVTGVHGPNVVKAFILA
jgi:L-lactate dehydrogenase complex protein LldG